MCIAVLGTLSNHTQDYGYGAIPRTLSNNTQNYGYGAVPWTLSNYTQDYIYGTQHEDKEVGSKTGIFSFSVVWATSGFFLVLLVARTTMAELQYFFKICSKRVPHPQIFFTYSPHHHQHHGISCSGYGLTLQKLEK
jgi:hypothetical protein